MRRLSGQDRADWAGVAAGVRPLEGRVVPEVVVPVRVAVVGVPRRVAGLGPLVVGVAPAGLDGGTWRRLGGGRMGVERRLDLHGMTLARAFVAFQEMMAAAVADGVRCVEVITGQGVGGEGVLRRELAGWLERPEVRRVIVAARHPHVRNPGSVLLLLKRRR